LDTALIAAAARELREFAKAGLKTNDSAARRMRLLERSPVLAELAPVQVAGGDSRARAEYLFQATIDAIDAMGHATAARGRRPGLITERDGMAACFTDHCRQQWREMGPEARLVMTGGRRIASRAPRC
jgi:hypothetical protein